MSLLAPTERIRLGGVYAEMESQRRRQHLLNGRRVQVSDLIDAGLIAPAARIIYRRYNDQYVATIDSRGHVRMPDGSRQRTLSGAARALSGTSVDGWYAWVVESTGRPIDTLRQELLESRTSEENLAADGSSSSVEEARRGRERHQFLRDAREAADKDPTRLLVRELLAHWDAETRDSELNEQIDAELSNYGLGTDPRFSAVALDDEVSLRALDSIVEPELDPSPATEPAVAASPDLPAVTTRPGRDGRAYAPITVGTVRSGSARIESVSPNATLEEAITRMALNDYSQLAVMEGTRNLKGAVNWRSIAQARLADAGAKVAAATFEVRAISYSTDLIDALPVLDEEGFFFVRGPKNEIEHIVTAVDVVNFYRDMTSPFLMIGEIDRMLRDIVEVTYDSTTIAAACHRDDDPPVTSVSQLSMGDYQQIIDHPARWPELEWPLDRRVFCDRLDEIRKMRNKVMHFSGDKPTEATVQVLRHFILLLRQYGTP